MAGEFFPITLFHYKKHHSQASYWKRQENLSKGKPRRLAQITLESALQRYFCWSACHRGTFQPRPQPHGRICDAPRPVCGSRGGLCRVASSPRPELPRPCFAFRQPSFFCPSHFNLPLEEREGRAASITMKRVVFFSYFQNCSKLKGAYNLRYKLQNQN